MKLSPLIVALDVDTIQEVERIVARLGAQVSFYKVGLKLFVHYGPEIIRVLKKKRKKIFLDLKLHDIPNTVAEACREAVRHGVDMLTIHAMGGVAMMQAAREAVNHEARKRKVPKPLIMGVTVLTSMESLDEINVFKPIDEQVIDMADLAIDAKLDGVICSPREIRVIRGIYTNRLKIVTPGIRPAGSDLNDQKRVMTPAEAYQYGADSLVVGRPILQAKDPHAVVKAILKAKRK